MDSLIWGGAPTAPGWYAVVVDYGRRPFPAARRWSGSFWDDARGILAFDGPHADAEAALAGPWSGARMIEVSRLSASNEK